MGRLTTPIVEGRQATDWELHSLSIDRDGGEITTVVRLLNASGEVIKTVTTTERAADAGLVASDLQSVRTKIIARLKVLGVIN
jgi:hypothetical protein